MTEKDIARARRHALGDLPRRSARRTPAKLAIVDGDTTLTFAELDDRIDRFAAALADAGLVKGDALAIFAHNCWQFPVVVFAAARLGVITVPINFMLTSDDVAYILGHSGARGLVVEDELVDTASKALAAVRRDLALTAVIRSTGALVDGDWVDVDSWLTRPGGPPPEVEVDDEDPIRIMYTSGTESRPKGVVLTSRSLLWQYTSCISTGGMSASDVEVHALPLYHCAQLDNFLATDIYLGATSIILRRPDPVTILRAIEEHRVTNLFGPPTVWIDLLNSPAFDSTDVSSLAKGYYGASAMPAEVLTRLGDRLPEMRFWNFYGQTEMASLATALPPEEQRTKPGAAGYPALNVETVVVDDDGRVLPAGEVGEIAHRSPHLTRGYLDDPEQSAAAFRDGWFHSGDLGYLDADGCLYVVDRKKDMIKTGGENVSSREVEEVIYQHPAVAEAAVFGVADPRWIEAIVAVVVPVPGADPSPEEILAFARERLAGYKTPKHVHVADALPKNPSGKILKRDLRTTYAPTRA
ncbi:MAG: fatty acyl-CoA synthetase [Nocardioides sp.]|uniref:fatty acyl-CoA synthetase n=1 Tax=Nocardioides sp. TaxID=35761 RepID=UPI0039E3EEDC